MIGILLKKIKYFSEFFSEYISTVSFDIDLSEKLFWSYKNIRWGHSKWRQINQNALILNRGLSSKFCWLRIANHVKFTDEYIMCTEKQVLIKNTFKNGINMGSPLRTLAKKTNHAVETHWLCVNKRFRA